MPHDSPLLPISLTWFIRHGTTDDVPALTITTLKWCMSDLFDDRVKEIFFWNGWAT